MSLGRERYIETPNYDGYLVIGAGLPRTGTASTRSALSVLMNGPIYHMGQVMESGFKHVSFWNEACQGSKSPEEWQEFLHGFRGGVDYPISLFYEELMEIFPNAKVVLTVREPESWYKSVKETIYQGNVDSTFFPMNVLNYLTGMNRFFEMAWNLGSKSGNRFNEGMFEAVGQGEAQAIAYFNNWNEKVKQKVAKDRLLIFNVKEGWAPLCDFLGVAVPQEPFPRTNDTAMMKKRFRRMKMAAYFFVIGLPIMIASISGWYFSGSKNAWEFLSKKFF